MRRSSGVLLFAVVMAGLLTAVPADAQRGPRRGGNVDRERLEQRVRAQMGRMMRERLGLSESEAEQLSEVTRGFDRRRRELFRSEQMLRREVEALRESPDPSAAAAAELLARMSDLREREAALFAEEQVALLEILTPVQVLELHAFREAIGRRIRALRGNRDDGRDRARRRGGRGPPGQR